MGDGGHLTGKNETHIICFPAATESETTRKRGSAEVVLRTEPTHVSFQKLEGVHTLQVVLRRVCEFAAQGVVLGLPSVLPQAASAQIRLQGISEGRWLLRLGIAKSRRQAGLGVTYAVRAPKQRPLRPRCCPGSNGQSSKRPSKRDLCVPSSC